MNTLLDLIQPGALAPDAPAQAGAGAVPQDAAEPKVNASLPSTPSLRTTGAVIPAADMKPWLEWQDLPAWLAAQRQQALEGLDEDLARHRAQKLAELEEELARHRASRHLALGQLQLRAVTELGQGLTQRCEDFAERAARLLAAPLRQDAHALQRLLTASLKDLLTEIEGAAPVGIHCAAADVAAVHQALAEAAPAVRLRARIAEDPDLEPGRCILRLGEEVYEVDLQQWLQSWQDPIEASCAELLAALGLPTSSSTEGTPSVFPSPPLPDEDDWLGDPDAASKLMGHALGDGSAEEVQPQAEAADAFGHEDLGHVPFYTDDLHAGPGDEEPYLNTDPLGDSPGESDELAWQDTEVFDADEAAPGAATPEALAMSPVAPPTPSSREGR